MDAPDLTQCGVLVNYLHWILLGIVATAASAIYKLLTMFQLARTAHMEDLQTALAQARDQLGGPK